MIAAYVRQLFYIAEQRSFAYMARMTGIPYRTVLAMRAGVIKLSSEFARSLRNMYQRESYGRLKQTGYSATEARRWSWYAPERVVIKELSLKHKIAELTTGAVAAKLKKEGIPTSKGAVDDIYDDMYEKVKAGIKTSIEPTETIMDY